MGTQKTPSFLKMQSLLSKQRTLNSPTGQDTPNTSPQPSHLGHMNSRRKMTVHGSRNIWKCSLKRRKMKPQMKPQTILSQRKQRTPSTQCTPVVLPKPSSPKKHFMLPNLEKLRKLLSQEEPRTQNSPEEQRTP